MLASDRIWGTAPYAWPLARALRQSLCPTIESANEKNERDDADPVCRTCERIADNGERRRFAGCNDNCGKNYAPKALADDHAGCKQRAHAFCQVGFARSF